MTAAYLTSDIQREVRAIMARADCEASAFYAEAPFVIDCRADSASFRAALTERQRDFIVERHAQGGLRYVSELARPGKDYAQAQLRRRHAELDRETRAEVDAFLRAWQAERGRAPGQAGKGPEQALASGVDIILPISGIQLSYDLSCVAVL